MSIGAPPHVGFAHGIDRIVMLRCGERNLSEGVLSDERAPRIDDGGALGSPRPSSCASCTSGWSCGEERVSQSNGALLLRQGPPQLCNIR